MNSDSDGDGLTDVVKTGGMYVGYLCGSIYTDPSDYDMDDDGLYDGNEIIVEGSKRLSVI